MTATRYRRASQTLRGVSFPGPKFDYKLRWFGRLAEHAGRLLATGEPVVVATPLTGFWSARFNDAMAQRQTFTGMALICAPGKRS